MTKNLTDFVLSSIAIGLIGLLSLLGTILLTRPLTEQIGDYHILADLFCFLMIYGLLSGLTVRLIFRIFPIPEGEFSMNDWPFTIFKLLSVIMDFGLGALRPVQSLAAMPVILALFGAKIGRNFASGGHVGDPYMTRIGDNVLIGNGSEICANYSHNGKIQFGYVTIGNNVTIGMHATILPGVIIGDGATVSIGSVVMPGTNIPPGETWRGNPARKWQ